VYKEGLQPISNQFQPADSGRPRLLIRRRQAKVHWVQTGYDVGKHVHHQVVAEVQYRKGPIQDCGEC